MKQKKRKPTKAATRRKALAQWSKEVRARDNNACCVCGQTEFVQAHHILVKNRYPEYSLDLNNGVSLCVSHHKFGKCSAHLNAIWFVEWLRTNKPDQYQWVLEKLKVNKDR